MNVSPADDNEPADAPDWMGADDPAPGFDLGSLLLPPDTPPDPVPAPPPPAPAPPQRRPRPAAAPSEPFLYGAVVALGSKVAASEVTVEHDVPPGLRVLATSPPVKVSRGRTLVWSFGRDAAGTKVPIRVKAVAAAGVDPAGLGPANFRTSYTATTTVGVPVVRPEAEVALTGPGSVELGASAALTLTVRNTGTCALRDAAVRVACDNGLSLLSGETIAFAAVPVGGEVTAAVRVAGRVAGAAAVRAELTATPPFTAACGTAVAVTAAKLDLSFAGPDAWRVNRDHPVRVAVRNTGTAPARVVGLRVTVPAGWTVTAAPDGFDAAARVAFAQADLLSPGDALELALTVRPTVPGEGAFHAAAEDSRGECRAELPARADLDPADSQGILERFVEEVGFAPGGPPPEGAGARASAATGREHPHVVFAVADTEYAFPLHAVREIGRPPAATPLPGAPGWLVGVANIRGGIVSMVDLRAFLDEPPGPAAGTDRRFLVVTAPGGDLTAGLLVDRVRGIQSIPPEQVRAPAAPIAARCAAYMTGVAGGGRRPVVVLEPDRLLLAPEFLPFGPA
ncbi:-like protein : CheW protein OS=Isosphaera pallida (strain ATCC 43644 / DSM 9630 / IS1B) GN=Isop_3688 PE=4 SV=1: NPCBM_assoc: CheW [Gemmataceae bacterium]|nr:-like protein : CheW protein OS=Isosphaera pallida (strain ATCC 43644 / DSM 9630 / IS1B) GN=Isop_3688 PE=4 SV=1: NPCBM_assoc: CheW [Gemmataceae bacterium]VTT97768.1 -like protein : CheW protein OS=Isosphaera pallida (strain ATCC 43644 / DSM 9630 / IS1B) GN=Isop_3688 PE=4 SV=1: NPCBM_assoc: CheW [Gemmataceae bacterium]